MLVAVLRLWPTFHSLYQTNTHGPHQRDRKAEVTHALSPICNTCIPQDRASNLPVATTSAQSPAREPHAAVLGIRRYKHSHNVAYIWNERPRTWWNGQSCKQNQVRIHKDTHTSWGAKRLGLMTQTSKHHHKQTQVYSSGARFEM